MTFPEQIRNAFESVRGTAYSYARRDMHADAADRLIQAYAYARVLNVYFANHKGRETDARNWDSTRNYMREQADYALLAATNADANHGLHVTLQPNGSAYEATPCDCAEALASGNW